MLALTKWQNLSQENGACLPSKSSLKHTRGAQTKTLSIWKAERGEGGREEGARRSMIEAVHTQPTCTDTHTETVTHQVLLPEILHFCRCTRAACRTCTPYCVITHLARWFAHFPHNKASGQVQGCLTPRNVNTKTHPHKREKWKWNARSGKQTAPPLYVVSSQKPKLYEPITGRSARILPEELSQAAWNYSSLLLNIQTEEAVV